MKRYQQPGASRRPTPPARQRGAVLLIGLVMLTVLAMIGLSYAQSSVMQERLAGNFKDMSIAFQSTEAGVRWPSAWIQSLGGNTLGRPFPCKGECDSSAQVLGAGLLPGHPMPGDDFWSNAKYYGVDPADNESLGMSVPIVTSQPRFIIEQQHFRRDDLAGSPQKGVAYYRATAMGTGMRKNSDAVVRSVLAKRFE